VLTDLRGGGALVVLLSLSDCRLRLLWESDDEFHLCHLGGSCMYNKPKLGTASKIVHTKTGTASVVIAAYKKSALLIKKNTVNIHANTVILWISFCLCLDCLIIEPLNKLKIAVEPATQAIHMIQHKMAMIT